MRIDFKIIAGLAAAAFILAGCNDETVPDKHTADLMKEQRDARMSRQPTTPGAAPGAPATGTPGQPAPAPATK